MESCECDAVIDHAEKLLIIAWSKQLKNTPGDWLHLKILLEFWL